MSVAQPFHSIPPAFRVQVVHEAGRVRVAPEGELDVATVDAVRSAVLRCAGRDGRSVVLDLSRLAFADSSQVHLLLELEAAAAIDGFAFAVRLGQATPARRVLALVGLDARFASA